MSPIDHLRRKLQERVTEAIRLIDECERMIEPEIRIGMSTYTLDQSRARELYACIEETQHCLRKLLVNI